MGWVVVYNVYSYYFFLPLTCIVSIIISLFFIYLSYYCVISAVITFHVNAIIFSIIIFKYCVIQTTQFSCTYILAICSIAGENRPTGAKFPMEIIDL